MRRHQHAATRPRVLWGLFLFTLIVRSGKGSHGIPARHSTASAALVMWAGSLTPTSVRIAVQPLAESDTVVVSSHRNLSAPVARLPVTRDEFVVAVRGLVPEMQYFYGLEGAPAVLAEFKTPSTSPLAPFRVAVGSCSWSANNGAVFANIAALEPRPLAFVHAGDLHYADIDENSQSRFEQAYQRVHNAEQRELFRSMPVMYVWDDHDFGANNADGDSPSKPAAMKAYRKYVPATFAAGMSNGSSRNAGIFQSYEIQGVLFILTDLVSQKSQATKSMLGESQKKWLLDLFARWREWRLIVWVSSKPWLGVGGDSDDGWAGFTSERLAISDAIASSGLSNLIMVAGDAHMLAIDDGTHTDFSSMSGVARENASLRAGFPLLQVAPLTGYGSSKSGPYSHGCMADKYFVNHHFGILDIDGGDQNSVCVRFQGMTHSGASVGLEYKTCAGTSDPAGGRPGIIRKGLRSSPEGSACTLPLAPGGMIAMLVVGLVLLLVAVLCDMSFMTRFASRYRMPAGASGEEQQRKNGPSEGAGRRDGALPSAEGTSLAKNPAGYVWIAGLVACHVIAIVLILVPVGIAVVPLRFKS